MPKNKCADWGKGNKWPDIDSKTDAWIQEQHQNGYIITRQAIRMFALLEAKKLGIKERNPASKNLKQFPVGATDSCEETVWSYGKERKYRNAFQQNWMIKCDPLQHNTD